MKIRIKQSFASFISRFRRRPKTNQSLRSINQGLDRHLPKPPMNILSGPVRSKNHQPTGFFRHSLKAPRVGKPGRRARIRYDFGRIKAVC